MISEGIIDSTREHFQKHGRKYLIGAGGLLASGIGLHAYAQKPEEMKALAMKAGEKLSSGAKTVYAVGKDVANTIGNDIKTIYNRDIKKD
jgi:hypothetical protein